MLSFKYTEGSACPKSSARRSTVVQLCVTPFDDSVSALTRGSILQAMR